MLQLTSRSPRHGSDLLTRWAGYRRECPVSNANALRQLWAAARYRAPADRPASPMLVLASASDGLVDPRCSMALAQRWGSPIAIQPWAGHDLPLDDGPWVAMQVEAWLQRLRLAGGVAVAAAS